MSTKNNGFSVISKGCKPSKKKGKTLAKKRSGAPFTEQDPEDIRRLCRISFCFPEDTLMGCT